ncbi:MAG TPA: recombinase family protein [Syntrophales bacterium]|jgi:DNA invertase Pin-like site-specific DNA recombinase|nr:recombinase family protein [Syntrophales bacterium]
MANNSKEHKKNPLHTPRVIAYVRVSTDEQDVNKQRHEILEYAHQNKMTIDEFIMITVSSRKAAKDRRIEELMEKLAPEDTLIISELSRLGRSIAEVIGLVNGLVERNVRLIAIKQNIDLAGKHDTTSKVMVTVFSLLAELERDLVSQRTKAALAALKAQGKKLGRPVGTKGKSKLDGKEPEIIAFLDKRVPVAAIARILGCSRPGLLNFMENKKIYKAKRSEKR